MPFVDSSLSVINAVYVSFLITKMNVSSFYHCNLAFSDSKRSISSTIFEKSSSDEQSWDSPSHT